MTEDDQTDETDAEIDLLADSVRSDDGDGAEPFVDADGATDGERDPSEGPLGELAARVDREERESLAATETFEEIETGDLSIEEVWAELEAGPGPTGELLDESEDVRRIEKSVCHDCPHFGDPPELRCTHDGTTIREMPDDEHFVVVECPVVSGAEGE